MYVYRELCIYTTYVCVINMHFHLIQYVVYTYAQMLVHTYLNKIYLWKFEILLLIYFQYKSHFKLLNFIYTNTCHKRGEFYLNFNSNLYEKKIFFLFVLLVVNCKKMVNIIFFS